VEFRNFSKNEAYSEKPYELETVKFNLWVRKHHYQIQIGQVKQGNPQGLKEVIILQKLHLNQHNKQQKRNDVKTILDIV